MPKELQSKILDSTVHSKVTYASPVWDPHHKTLCDKIEKVQRRGARFVFNSRHIKSKGNENESPTEMMEQLGWTPLETRRKNTIEW